MFLVQAGFYKPKASKGMLFGSHDEFPLWVVNFLLFQLVIPIGDTSPLFRQALDGLLKDDDWHINNAPSVRLAKRKAKAKAYTAAQKNEEEVLKIWKDGCRDANKELSEANRQIRELETTVKTLRGLDT